MMMTKILRNANAGMMGFCAAFAVCLVALCPPEVSAQSYPTKPIRIIVTSTAGAGGDIVARLVGGKLTDFVGQQVIVDNRAGATIVLNDAQMASPGRAGEFVRQAAVVGAPGKRGRGLVPYPEIGPGVRPILAMVNIRGGTVPHHPGPAALVVARHYAPNRFHIFCHFFSSQ
jgi:hypothetical protein